MKRYTGWTYSNREFPLGALVLGGRTFVSQDVNAPHNSIHPFVFEDEHRFYILWHADDTEDQPEYMLIVVDRGDAEDIEIPVTSRQYRELGFQRPPENYAEAALVVEAIAGAV